MDTRNVETCGARRGLLGCWALGLAILASVALLAACSGRGLVDETYPGHALATAQGSLAATAEPVRDAVSLGIAWLPSGVGGHPLDRIEALLDPRPFAGTRCAVVPLRGVGASPEGLVSQALRHTSALPFQFKFSVLSAPPPAAGLGPDGRVSFGLVVAYVDVNGSGTYDRDADAPDRLVGLSADAARTQLLVFVDGPMPTEWFPREEALKSAPGGFSVLTLADDATFVALDDAYFELSPALIGDGRLCP